MWWREVQRRDVCRSLVRGVTKPIDMNFAAVLERRNHVCTRGEKRKVPNVFWSFILLNELKGIVREKIEREMEWAHDELLSGHPVPDEHGVERHPKVHPHDILDDLYHAPMHRSKRKPTQHRDLRRRMGRHDARTEPPKMHADISAGATARRNSRTMLQEHNEVLRRIKRKVLNAHAQVVHAKQPGAPLPVVVIPRQPRGDQPPRSTVDVLERLCEQPADELVRVAAARERHGRARVGPQGAPGCAALEQDLHARCGGRCCAAAWVAVDEPV